MLTEEIRLVVIFDPCKENEIKFNSIAFVEGTSPFNLFLIKSGKYKGRLSSDFNILRTSDGESIFDSQVELKYEEFSKNKKSLYVIDDKILMEKYYDNILRYKIDAYDKYGFVIFCTNICNFELLDTLLKIDNNGKIEKTEKNSGNILSTSNIINMLKGYNNDHSYIYKKDVEYEEYWKKRRNILEKNLTPQDLNKRKSIQKIVESSSPKEKQELETFDSLLNRMLQLEEKLKVKEENKKEEISDIKVNSVIDKITNKIIGQDDAIKTLVSNIYHNQKLIDFISEQEEIDPSLLDSSKVSILLDGETGTGKTAIEKEIAKELDLPIVITSANSFSETGYVGPTITDILKKLLDQTNGDIKKAERGIVVLDEIDKITKEEGIAGKSMHEGVQNELLSFIGGGEYDISNGGFGFFSNNIKFDTSKLTFILSGAFTDLREQKIKDEEKKYKSMGFTYNDESNNEKTYTLLPEDYIKFGLKREFFGRIKVLTGTKSYDHDAYKKILLESKISPLKNFEKTVKLYGYKGIKYDESFVNKLAEEAVKMKTGARGLQTVMSGIQNKLLMGLINHEFDLDKKIKLTTNLIDEYNKSYVRKY